MNKEELQNLYYKTSVRKIAEQLKCSRNRVYDLLESYDITLKQSQEPLDKWMNRVGVPANVEEYHNKWKNYAGAPLSRLLESEEVEDKYLSSKF